MDGRETNQYELWKEEVYRLRTENQHLLREVDTYRPAWYRASERVGELERRVTELTAENERLKQQVKELTLAARQAPGVAEDGPAVKPAAARKKRKRPGRKEGHPAALRPLPDHIDSHLTVPLPLDSAGHECCTCCNTGLLDMRDHERLVEDIIPAKVVATSYHTRSGFCPKCKKRVESRAPEQPPAANIPHGQLGLNALATAMLLKVEHRLPFRQVTQVFANLPELKVSPGAIARQVQRVADWFGDDYEKLMVALRGAPHVHADETGWRADGKNVNLWAVTSPDYTLYHIDKSRGGKVIQELLGKAFGGTLVSDFYSAYSTMDCKKQKCLVHLLRELNETAEACPAFGAGSFFSRSKRLIKQMLLLKGQWNTLSAEQYVARGERMEARLGELALADYDEDNATRLAKRMRRHQKELTAFLWQKNLDGTNNAAERALRPAVVARKISGGSRSEAGADAWATVASLIRTAGQQGKNVFDSVKSLMMAAWAKAKPPTMPSGP
jgi:transposase